MSTEGGAIVTRAVSLPLPALTSFQDPRVSVRSLSARRQADGFTVTATGRVTG